MKKITLVLMAFIGLALSVRADGETTTGADANIPVATLFHTGNVTAFYGNSALEDAITAAVAGDTIQLSAGNFTAPENNVTKALTIRGTNISNAVPTLINGDIYLDLNSANATMVLEGLYFGNNSVYYQGVIKALTISKCRIYNFTDYQYALTCDNLNITQCLIQDLYLNVSGNVTVYNSVVDNLNNSSEDASFHAINCIVKTSSGDDNMSFTNCILHGTSIYYNFNADYCAFIGGNTSGGMVLNSYPNVSYASMFTSFRGTYSDNASYELTATAQTTYLGSEGTQIGIYGGYLPYNPAPLYPQITVMNVGKQSNADGTLDIEIQLSTPANN